MPFGVGKARCFKRDLAGVFLDAEIIQIAEAVSGYLKCVTLSVHVLAVLRYP